MARSFLVPREASFLPRALERDGLQDRLQHFFEPADHIFGQHASVALATARREAGLRQAIDARHLIGQAQGILMERFDLTADQSFAVLRRYSQENNVKLRSVAAEIIETRKLPGVVTPAERV